MENMSQHVEGIEDISDTTLEDALRWWGESEETGNFDSTENEGLCGSPFLRSGDDLMNHSLMLPPDDMEVEGRTSLRRLLKAYGEAMEMGQEDLANVIVGCINEKASPLGGTMERVAFNLFQSGNQGDYIKQESLKNFKAAFKAFYEIFPYGRFSHFAANSAILEAIMSDSGKVHIIDFDIGEGVQWPTMLDALGKLRKETKLTSIRTGEQSYTSFEETRNQLLDYASASGLKLDVQEITIGELVNEIEESEDHECLAFNCMLELPHMGRTRSRSQVKEFLKVAKQLLSKNKGIITIGDGEDVERMKYCGGYSSFIDECLNHYQTLCESMEGNFPEYLTEARIAMESLFVAPYVSSLLWHKKWVNLREDSEFKENLGLMGWRLSKESLAEAKEMVKGRESSYKIKVEGQNGNEMVLEYRGAPLVRVSAWK
ncbi:Transcription factor GRAS [Cynara cardunculus var. scolymus]|uniref:Transcription factor GRAS n=2 Tax=Cynara cardunculus var. scolymus TaxID=59895 RepID=A0A103YLU2_CYNCS|nr:Transcription factor GRAS [Cynara cardunculus var. scolymus]